MSQSRNMSLRHFSTLHKT